MWQVGVSVWVLEGAGERCWEGGVARSHVEGHAAGRRRVGRLQAQPNPEPRKGRKEEGQEENCTGTQCREPVHKQNGMGIVCGPPQRKVWGATGTCGMASLLLPPNNE